MNINTTSLGQLTLTSDMMDAQQISSYVEEYSDGELSLSSVHPVQNRVIAKYLTRDFTSFEVYPTQTDISGKTSLEEALAASPSLTADPDFLELSSRSIDRDTGIQYIEDVEPRMKASLELRTIKRKSEIDVAIDWGDGSVTVLKNQPVVPYSSIPTYSKDGRTYCDLDGVNGIIWYYEPDLDGVERAVQLVHDYRAEGKYNVKIYGSDYYGVRCGLFSGGIPMEDPTKYNILSECLGYKHKFASCVRNASSFANGSARLQRILIPAYTADNIANATAIFKNCVNLINVECNSQNTFLQGRSIQPAEIFSGCKNLRTCDSFYVPLDVMSSSPSMSYSYMFYKCQQLTSDITQLLPRYGFRCRFIDISNFFSGCENVSCSDYGRLAGILWKDTSRVFSNFHSAFTGCSSLDMSKIPSAWGGTDSSVKINPETGTVYESASSEIAEVLESILA